MGNGATSDERFNSLENVTKTIGNLLDGYDIRLRPNFGGAQIISIFAIIDDFDEYFLFQTGDPLYVGFDLTIASFDSISEVSMVSSTLLSSSGYSNAYMACYYSLHNT